MKLKLLVLIIALLVMAGCVAKENDSTSGSFLVINSLTGNDLAGKAGSTTVFSDVSLAGSIVNDNGVASLTTLTYNPLEDSEEHDITFYMNVIVDQIDVEFMRTDGRNVEGVDVPYRFTQPMNMLWGSTISSMSPLSSSATMPSSRRRCSPCAKSATRAPSCSWWPRSRCTARTWAGTGSPR